MNLDIQIDLSKIDLSVDKLIDDIKKNMDIANEDEYKVKLICKELLTNIILYSEASAIQLNSNTQNGCLKIIVEDNGKGFDYSKIIDRDVTDDAHIMADGGRGIFLIKRMSDDFTYSADGRKIEILLNLK